jgi:hypothetical protein
VDSLLDAMVYVVDSGVCLLSGRESVVEGNVLSCGFSGIAVFGSKANGDVGE